MFWMTLRSIAASASSLATDASSSEHLFSAVIALPSSPSTYALLRSRACCADTRLRSSLLSLLASF